MLNIIYFNLLLQVILPALLSMVMYVEPLLPALLGMVMYA